ncbi:conjugal transfer protein [Enterococcus faecalis]|uniref:conjugal transfer protein n=1 Tax=Enterococcus faecalis TaxID=1351 RepID=UPI000CF2EDB6|nr:conjugal transfer protein [Enterococcus faecalis]EIT2192145.1 conjugal transfer protein [Enterococcus faecalis]EIY5962568.1 conjugal transfer protein [Enterococcus faecalis]EKZ0176713.1 conjugal transfer protein [Enterococcus faecalis]MBP4070142.1 conjugal transfer protein [Enterococcus faecalis]MBP4101019.1 conjugal transfer protein [Enterococcus faecalis]
MKKLKSYTSIWAVEKVIYAINDFQLPFPVTFSQMAWFVLTLLAMILFGNLTPLVFIQGAFLKYLAIPACVTWFMSKKTFDGKHPYGFLRSVILYLVRPKVTYAGKKVTLNKQKVQLEITTVRSEVYDPNQVH